MELPLMQLRPPFLGTRTAAASRTLGPQEAHDSLNVWTSDGDIRVRPAVSELYTSSLFGYPSGRFPALMVKAMPIFAGDKYWLLTVHILDNGWTYVKIVNPENGEDAITHTMTYTNAAGWRVGVAQFGNVIYVICGVATNAVKFWLVGSTWNSDIIGAGLHGAPSAATLIAGGSLTVDTAYSYRCTYYSSVTGTESAPSTAVSATTAGANLTIRLTGLTASADDAIDTRRIYRKQNLIDDTWYLLSTQSDAATSFDDSGSITPTKTVDNRMPLFAFDVTDNIANCAVFKRRMWYALDAQPGVYVHSELDKPESVNPLNTYAANEDDGDPVMSMISVDEALFCLRLRSIDVITGDSPESFVCSKLLSGIGCVSQSSVCDVGSRVFFMSIQGLYEINGGQVSNIPISDPVRDQMRASEALGLTISAIDTEHGLLIMSIPTQPISELTPPRPLNQTAFTQYVYDYWRDRWFIWSMHARGLGIIQRNSHTQYPREIITEIRPPPASASIEFKIGLLDFDRVGPDFEIYPIAWFWETGDFDLNSVRDKHFYYATLFWNGDAAADDALVSLRWYRNQLSIPVDSAQWPANQDPTRGKVKMGFTGDTIRFNISGDANHQLRIVGLDFEAEQVGHR